MDMSFIQFTTEILNIKEDLIEELQTIKQSDGCLIIKIKLKNTNSNCPYCKSPCKVHGYYQRKLKHASLANRECVIIYSQRRYRCLFCELTFSENNPFTCSRGGLTYETKINILKELKYPTSTYLATAQRYHVSKTTVLKLFDSHVNIPRKPLTKVLSIDEHYFPESDFKSLYCCLLMDFETGVLLDILPSRKKSYLTQYFAKIKAKTLDFSTLTSELDNVKYISIDMYDNYRDIASIYFPNAIVCADSFHVLQHLTKDFSQVRLRCRRETQDKDFFYFLTSFKYVFQHNAFLDNTPRYNRRLGRDINRRDIRDMLFQHFPELKVAYELKEYYINFNKTSTAAYAEKHIDDIIALFAGSGIEEYDEFYNLLCNWKQEILNSFTIVNGKRINNSYIESKNGQLEKLRRNANGFRNFERTRKRILYCLNPNETFTL